MPNQRRILSPVKMFLRKGGKIKVLSDKGKFTVLFCQQTCSKANAKRSSSDGREVIPKGGRGLRMKEEQQK